MIRLRGRVNGKRGWFLILLAIVFVGIGLSYLQPSVSRAKTFDWLPEWLPSQWLSVAWGIGALTAIVAAFRADPRADLIGFATISLILTGWGFIYLWAWLAGTTPNGWYSASIFWTFAGLVSLVAGWANPPPPNIFTSLPPLRIDR